jgi:hypothetical protein
MFVVSRLVHGLDLRRLLTLGVGFVLLSWPVIWVLVVLARYWITGKSLGS